MKTFCKYVFVGFTFAKSETDKSETDNMKTFCKYVFVVWCLSSELATSTEGSEAEQNLIPCHIVPKAQTPVRGRDNARRYSIYNFIRSKMGSGSGFGPIPI